MAATNNTSTRGFESRHIGPQGAAITTMLERVGAGSLEELMNDIVPDAIRQQARGTRRDPFHCRKER